jgi:type II secretory pathway pseudopilin PulG
VKLQIPNIKFQKDSRGIAILQAIVLFLIVIIIVTTVGIAYGSAKSQAQDKQRLSDASKIAEALKLYFDINGFYPTSVDGLPKGIEAYLDFYPTPPNPNGVCTSVQTYSYERKDSGTDYILHFCLGESGMHTVTSKGIQ